jgi:hypothetical protein
MAPQRISNTGFFRQPKFSIISEVSVQPLFKNESFLRREYLENQRSTKEIAAQIFSARSTVAKYLKLYGIELRPEDVAHRLNKGQVAYGERRIKQREIEHKREIELIAKMQDLRGQGFSYHKIAAILNSMNVPTKNRKRWHATTVMNILK